LGRGGQKRSPSQGEKCRGRGREGYYAAAAGQLLLTIYIPIARKEKDPKKSDEETRILNERNGRG